MAECLLENKAYAHIAGNVTASTALHCATQFNHVDIIPLLLRHGGDVDACDACGYTALMIITLGILWQAPRCGRVFA